MGSELPLLLIIHPVSILPAGLGEFSASRARKSITETDLGMRSSKRSLPTDDSSALKFGPLMYLIASDALIALSRLGLAAIVADVGY